MTLAIAIDAMGGDHAPREVVRGAVEAARMHRDLRLLLVGREDAIGAELDALNGGEGDVAIVPAEHAISMSDSPVEALRRRKGSSIEVATRLVSTGEACALVSAGNTGACVAAGTILLGLLPGVRRAGIAVCLPAGASHVVLVDVGANVSSKPEHLLQYGVMASLYARSVLRVENPRLGLLSIGEESGKGNPLVKSANALFRESGLNFVGNVEGVEVFRGVCDVIVCDGFVGNIVLKVSEGLAEQLLGSFRGTVEHVLRSVQAQAPSMVQAAAPTSLGIPNLEDPDPLAIFDRKMRSSLATLRERTDYAEYGGAPLLGVLGVMIIAHGRSDARAITNAIRVAKRMVETNINRHITDEIRALSERS